MLPRALLLRSACARGGERRTLRPLLRPPPPLALHRPPPPPVCGFPATRAQLCWQCGGEGLGMVLAGQSGSPSRPGRRLRPSLTRRRRTTHTRRATSPPSAWTSCVPVLRRSPFQKPGQTGRPAVLLRSRGRLALSAAHAVAAAAAGLSSRPVAFRRPWPEGGGGFQAGRCRQAARLSSPPRLRVLSRPLFSSPPQKIRTVELEGKTIKLQIVRPARTPTRPLRPLPPPAAHARPSLSGTRRGRSASGPSQAPTTAARTASSWCTT